MEPSFVEHRSCSRSSRCSPCFRRLWCGRAAGTWTPIGSDRARPLDESQGLATVVRPDGTVIRYTGIGTVPPDLFARGWNHVGDPGTALGYYVEPYQRDDRGA